VQTLTKFVTLVKINYWPPCIDFPSHSTSVGSSALNYANYGISILFPLILTSPTLPSNPPYSSMLPLKTDEKKWIYLFLNNQTKNQDLLMDGANSSILVHGFF
jgi:hypothetical protein